MGNSSGLPPPSARPVAARDPAGAEVGSTIGVADPLDRLPDEGYYGPSAEHSQHVAGPDRQGDWGGDARVEQPHCDDLGVLESEDGDRPQEGQEKDGLDETHDVTPDEKFDDPLPSRPSLRRPDTRQGRVAARRGRYSTVVSMHRCAPLAGHSYGRSVIRCLEVMRCKSHAVESPLIPAGHDHDK
jgi:hypothetical protein